MNKKQDDILVSIKCLTYNQEKYIAQCLEGFVMQKTDFRFEAVVHDDASTDGTASFIREYAEKYPDIIKPIYQTENQYSKKDGSLNRIVCSHLKGKYVAICEGDDYWTDPLKLQKQVDFMEANPDCGLCYTKVHVRHFDGEEMVTGTPVDGFYQLLNRNRISTLTVMMRNDLMQKYYAEVQPHRHNWKMGDYPMWLWIALHSKIHFLEDVTATYRISTESASHSTNVQKLIDFQESVYDVRKYFITNYKDADKKLLRESLTTRNWYMFRIYIVKSHDKEAFRFMRRNICDFTLEKLFLGLAAWLSPRFRNFVRKRWKMYV